MWGLGDYARVAERLIPTADTIAGLAGEGDGQRAVDVAAGTGSVAIRLARRGWRVDACDISPALITRGRQASADAGVTVEWHESSLDDLPFEDASLDLVASSFGLIFAPDAEIAVTELRRCLRPGGQLIFSAWTPAGYMGQMTEEMSRFMPSAPAGPSPMDWGRSEVVAERLAGDFTDVTVRTESLPWHFDSAEAATAFCFEHSPAHVASLTMAGYRANELREAVRSHLEASSRDERAVRIDAEYIMVTATAK